jgi:hypothetical protein
MNGRSIFLEEFFITPNMVSYLVLARDEVFDINLKYFQNSEEAEEYYKNLPNAVKKLTTPYKVETNDIEAGRILP